MCTFLANDTLTARKKHQCTWCGQAIEAGSKYVRQRIIGDDGPCTNKLHPECDTALDDTARHEGGGCIYFDFGSMPRGGYDSDQVTAP